MLKINLKYLENFLYRCVAEKSEDYEGCEDYDFLNIFLFNIYETNRKNYFFLKNNFSIRYTYMYYYHTFECSQHSTLLKISNNDIKFFLILNNKINKLKYSLLNSLSKTIVTMSLGILSNHFEQKKKSLKKSQKILVIFMKFLKKTITKIVKNKKYVFIINGLNKRIFKFINFFNFVKTKSNISIFFLKPLYAFGKRIFKKIKSIKRKLQKKNIIKINESLKLIKI